MAERIELQPAPRRRRRRQDSEQEILEAAERLLRERPFRELTVDDLMATTTQSRTAFYRHFTGRQDLLIRLLSDLNQELWEVSQGWFQGGGEDPLAEAREALERLAGVYQAHGPVLLAMAEAAHHDDEVERVYGALVQGFADGVVARLELNAAALAQRAGHYPAPPGSPADVPGLELAGEVVAVGRGVLRFRPGDRVMSLVGGGGQAELAVVHERVAMPLPHPLRLPPGRGLPP